MHIQIRDMGAAVLCRHTHPSGVFQSIADLGVRRIELVPAAHHDESVAPSREEILQYSRFVRDYDRQGVRNDRLAVAAKKLMVPVGRSSDRSEPTIAAAGA